MQAFLDRLGLVIHWSFFLIALSIPILGLGGTIFSGDEDFYGILTYSPILFAFFSLIGWLFRFILSGKNHFLPFK